MAREKKPEEAPAGCPAWLATYGDLMTLLLCFFVLLFAMSNVDEGKLAEVAAALSGSPINLIEIASIGTDGILEAMGNGIMEVPNAVPKSQGPSNNEGTGGEDKANDRQEVLNMASDFETYLTENGLQDVVDIKVYEDYIHMVFADGLFFDVGKADVKPDAKHVLDMIIVELIQYPDSDIRVEGHTDNMPINTFQYKNNLYLSNARAAEVAMYLMDTGGINPERVSSQGFGETRPIGDNQTVEGREMNRRVEIKILGKSASGTK